MLDDWQICHFLLAPNLMFRLYFGLGLLDHCFFWFLSLGLVLFPDLCLDLSIGLSDLLLLTFGADRSWVEHAAFVWIFHDVRIFLACNEILEGHQRTIVKHLMIYK